MTTTHTPRRITPADAILLYAQEQTGSYTTELDRMLTHIADGLSAALHSPADCDLAEDCPVCPLLRLLVDLAAAYHQLQSETTATDTAKATA